MTIVLTLLFILQKFAFIELETSDCKPFNLLNVCLYSQFYYFGNVSKRHEEKFINFFRKPATVGILTFIYIIILVLQTTYLTQKNLIYGFTNIELSSWVLLLLTIGIFVQAENYFNKETKFSSGLKFIGKRTLDIYFLHYYLIPDISWMQCIFANNQFVLQVVALSVIAAIIIAFTLAIDKYLRKSKRLTELLFGK